MSQLTVVTLGNGKKGVYLSDTEALERNFSYRKVTTLINIPEYQQMVVCQEIVLDGELLIQSEAELCLI